MRPNKYTKEQRDFILQLAPYKTAREISDLFYEKYNIRISNGMVNKMRFENKIKLDYYESKIQNDNQRKWLLNILKYHNNKETIKLFKNKFGIELNESVLNNTRHYYKVKRVYKQIRTETVPLYSEKSFRGIDFIRVPNNKYQIKTRYVWEQYYGRKIPKDYDVVFLDGDKTNYDIKNLALVKRGVRIFMLKSGIEHNDKDIIKTATMICKLDKKLKNKMEVY